MNYLVVFTSRNETLKMSKMLERNHVPFSMINTPRDITSSCSISIKVNGMYVSFCKRILSNTQFYTFVGIFQYNY